MDLLKKDDRDYFAKNLFVKELKPSDFDPVATWALKDKNCSIVLFYAPWCGYCKAVKEEWIKLGKIATFMEVCSFNCEKYKGHLEKIQHDMPQLVRSYPTIIFYKHGNPVEQYDGDRTYQNLLKACMRVCKEGRS